MEGVEDLPGTALAEGIRWAWESFPEYLDALDAMPWALDVATQVPHAAVRAYVMGDRAHGLATEADIAAMAEIVRTSLRAGPSASPPAGRPATATSTASRFPAPSRPRPRSRPCCR